MEEECSDDAMEACRAAEKGLGATTHHLAVAKTHAASMSKALRSLRPYAKVTDNACGLRLPQRQ